MIIRAVVRGDMEIIKDWLIIHSMSEKHLGDLPFTGLIVEDGKEQIAAGFIRYCEGKLAILDSIITNPEAESIKRHDALDMIFKRVIDDARLMGMKRLIGFTADTTMVFRSERFGFKESNYTVMVRGL